MSKAELDGGEAIIEAFRNLGIEYIICSPGSEWPPVWEALARQKTEGLNGPAYLDCGHETLAVGIATGYTQITGRMQAVLLHAGTGLLQGAMGIQGARALEIPMVVMSGESLTYGERQGFDPGNAWYRNLGVVGGPHRLVDSIVKWACQATSPETLYHGVVRAGEMAQRNPRGPVFLNVPLETMVSAWKKPKRLRKAPPASAVQPVDADVRKVADLIRNAKCPVIITEQGGRTPEAFESLVALSDSLSIPVFEARAAAYANFPKTHPMYAGSNYMPCFDQIDLALLVASRVPWYPPSHTPPNAKIVSISSNPFKDHMVYQVMDADLYLEGDVEISLTMLLKELQKSPTLITDERRMKWKAEHDAVVKKARAAEDAATNAPGITAPLLCQALNEVMPDNTIYVDETLVHSPILRELLTWEQSHSFFRAPPGLGQSFGIALGMKLAASERTVVLLVGDGAFLYNPVLPAVQFAKDHGLPILVVVLNNNKYEAMRRTHLNIYPSGVSAKNDLFYGVTINGPDYASVAGMADGFGVRVEEKSELKGSLLKALAAVQDGKISVVNVIVDD